MPIFQKENLTELLNAKSDVCLSLYMPTHRSHPDNAGDSILYQNLVKQLKQEATKLDAAMPKGIFDNFEKLAQNYEFWKHTLDGLAVFANEDFFKVYTLQRKVTPLAVAATSFHVKPLLKFLQSLDKYQVLVLNINEVQMYEGNRHQLDKLELPADFPKNLKAALGHDKTEPHLTVGAYGGAMNNIATSSAHGGTANMVQGQGGRKDEMEIDTERFFRVVDKAVWESFSRDSGLPLLLTTLPEHQSLFRKVSSNHKLLEDGLAMNAGALTNKELQKQTWAIIESHYKNGLQEHADSYAASAAHGKGTDNPELILKDIIAGRVATLLLEEGRVVKGKIAQDYGKINYMATDVAGDDVLDDLGELAIKYGGEVIVMSAEKMPTSTGVAAINRY